MRAVLRDRVALVALILLAVIAGLAILAPLIAPQNPWDPRSLDLMNAELPPFWRAGSDPAFRLGTDAQGRDMLSAILYGAGISLAIGLLAVAIQATVGIGLGLLAGYAGGRVDTVVMRLADVQLSLSTLMVAIIALALMQAAVGAENFGTFAIPMLALVIGLAEWPHFARTARGSVLAEKQKPYVLAAQALGQAPRRIIMRHILPNVSSPLIVVATVQVANAIMAEAALSFLGLGMPVTQPSLGSLIRSGFDLLLAGAWWITLWPSVLLVAIILSINLVGDALRDALNPRLFRVRRVEEGRL
jgi:peptide/nickel transport system permease protein